MGVCNSTLDCNPPQDVDMHPREGDDTQVDLMATQVAAGPTQCVALSTDGKVICWGTPKVSPQTPPTYGDLEAFTGFPQEVTVLEHKNIVALSCGRLQTMGLTADGEVWCFGGNPTGDNLSVSGLPHQVPLPEKVRALAVGICHICLITRAGKVWASGAGDQGQLGQANLDSSSVFLEVEALRGDFISEVTCGGLHTLAISDSRICYSWGANDEGQAGHGQRSLVAKPAPVRDREGILEEVTGLSAGNKHSMLLTRGGICWGFGDGSHGKLAQGDTRDRVSAERCKGFPPAVCIAAGREHTVAVTTRGEVWTVGAGRAGQLGLGDWSYQINPCRVVALHSCFAVKAAAAENHSLVLDDEGYIWSFGNNSAGELGLGDTYSRAVPQQVLRYESSAGTAPITLHDYYA